MQTDYGTSVERRAACGSVGALTPRRTSGRHPSPQRRVNLAGIDLNLLVALEACWRSAT